MQQPGAASGAAYFAWLPPLLAGPHNSWGPAVDVPGTLQQAHTRGSSCSIALTLRARDACSQRDGCCMMHPASTATMSPLPSAPPHSSRTQPQALATCQRRWASWWPPQASRRQTCEAGGRSRRGSASVTVRALPRSLPNQPHRPAFATAVRLSHTAGALRAFSSSR